MGGGRDGERLVRGNLTRRLTAAVLAGVATAGVWVATTSPPSFGATPFQGHGSIGEAYAIGAKQYVAVQGSGRHLHPVKYDNLETSSYLFVFALN